MNVHLEEVYQGNIFLLKLIVSSEWDSLRQRFPTLCEYDSCREFESITALSNFRRREHRVYRELTREFNKHNSARSLLIVLFRGTLHSAMRQANDYYKGHFVIDDLWGIVTKNFIEYFAKHCPNVTTAGKALTQIRYNTLEEARQTYNKDNGAAAKLFKSLEEKGCKVISHDTQCDTAFENEIWEYLKSGLSPIEYESLVLRAKYELYRRGKKRPEIEKIRDKAAERRAIRKARVLLGKLDVFR